MITSLSTDTGYNAHQGTARGAYGRYPPWKFIHIDDPNIGGEERIGQ